MIELPIAQLLASFQRLATLGQLATLQVQQKVGIEMSRRDYDEQVEAAKAFVESCYGIGFLITERVATELIAELANSKTEPNGKMTLELGILSRVGNIISAFSKCLPHEAKTKAAFSLTPEMMALYDPPEPHWGAETRAKFPSGLFEIDEASRCLALGRSTACVFHLMRMLEICLRAVAKCLALPTIGPNWGDVLRAMRDDRTRRGNTWSERELFNDLYARLDAIRDAWRNTTMHVENVYTEQQAKEILEHTRSFVGKLATRMDESGLPLA